MSEAHPAIGRSETARDLAAAAPLARLAALLDHDTPPWPDGEMPPLGHWLSFLPDARQSLIGPDGHPQRGGFLPAADDLPRRMWAGSRVTFIAPVAIGALLERTSTITRVERKEGRSGALLFVTVRHDVRAEGSLAVIEEQDIVYREAAPVGTAPAAAAPVAATTPASPAPEGEYRRTVAPDEAMLFRFSALTFNAHRIHYDRDYARQVEGYADLVVHGPFTATLLMDHVLRHHPGRRVARFAFTGKRPLLLGAPFALHGTTEGDVARLWVVDGQGHVCMSAEADFA